MLSKYSYLREDCDKCDGKGHIISNKRQFKDGEEDTFAKQCDCVKKMALYHRYDEANIPREYFDLSIDGFKETSAEKVMVKREITKIIGDIKSYYRNGRGLFLYGRKGTGKTMLALEVLKGACKAGYSIYYDFYPVIFNEFTKKGYKADEVKAKYEDIFTKVDFLVLDELLKERDYFNGASESNDIVSSRFLEMNILKKRASKPTIIISNIKNGLVDIKQYYGPYVYSVMSHTYDLIQFNDEDFREASR